MNYEVQTVVNRKEFTRIANYFEALLETLKNYLLFMAFLGNAIISTGSIRMC